MGLMVRISYEMEIERAIFVSFSCRCCIHGREWTHVSELCAVSLERITGAIPSLLTESGNVRDTLCQETKALTSGLTANTNTCMFSELFVHFSISQ